MEWRPDCMDPSPPEKSPWSFADNKTFEIALSEFTTLNHDSPSFFNKIAERIPWKSTEDIKNHYQALLHDVEMIESGLFPVSDDYGSMIETAKGNDPLSAARRTKIGKPRRKGVPWTEEEHQLFLMGLQRYGKGDWRSIARNYVTTKTPTQVASHAQKYFRRQASSTPAEKRRPSIHDVQAVNTTALMDQLSVSGLVPGIQTQIPFVPDVGLGFPMINGAGFAPTDSIFVDPYGIGINYSASRFWF